MAAPDRARVHVPGRRGRHLGRRRRPGLERRAASTRLAALTGTATTRESSGQARFVSRDELRYSLRSLHLFAPWVRRIHLVTAGQVPDWLDPDHPQVTVVDHAEILPPDALPTFNSHAIESALHKVPDLAEHFVYLNDDFFLGRPLGPEAFFTPAGLAAVWLSPNTVGLGETPDAPPYLKAAWNNRRLLQEAFGAVLTDNLAHAPYPHRRSVLEEIERRFPDEVARDRALAVPLRHRPVDAELVRPALRAADRARVRRASPSAPTSTSATATSSGSSGRPSSASRTSSAWPTTTTTRSTRAARPDPGGVHGGVLPCGRAVGARRLIWTTCTSRRGVVGVLLPNAGVAVRPCALDVQPSAYRSCVGSPRAADLGNGARALWGEREEITGPGGKDLSERCRGTPRRGLVGGRARWSLRKGFPPRRSWGCAGRALSHFGPPRLGAVRRLAPLHPRQDPEATRGHRDQRGGPQGR